MTDSKIEEVLLDPDTIIKLATQLKQEREQRKQLEVKVKRDKHKVLFAEAVSASSSSILVGELAKILRQNGINIGQNRLFEQLRDEGFLIKRKGTDWNMPTQKSMNMGLFQIKEHTYLDGQGTNVTKKTVRVTGKGQAYFINKYMSEEVS